MRQFVPVLGLLLCSLVACGEDDGKPGAGSGAAVDAADNADGATGIDGSTGDAGAVDGVAQDTGTPDAGIPDSGIPDSGTPDSGTPDSGTPDSGTPDAGTPDSGTPDSGTPDSGTPDSGTPDSGTPDSGTPDAGTPDAGTPDSGTPDAGTPDAGSPDSGTPDAGTPGCSKDSECAAKDDGDLCNGVWFCDAGTCKAKPSSAVTCATDKDTACSKATCDPKTGACAPKAVADGAACSDGDACTLSDTCKAGACVAGSAAVCDDKQPCTKDSCDKAKGCQVTPLDDGASCGAGKVCAASACVSPLAAGKCGVGGVKPCRTLTGGYGHMCALFGGSVRCWGANAQGQLGTGGTNIMTKQPGTAVLGVAKAVAVVGGWSFGCALLAPDAQKAGGTVACWGANARGELGNGKSESDYPKDKAFEAKAAVVAGLTGVVDVAATVAGTVCALTDAGQVSCWGSGATGSLGDGKSTETHHVSKPQPVAGLKDVVSLSAGSGHLCAVDKAGALWCWGYNAYGQVGNGKAGADYPNVALAGETKPVQITTAGAVAEAFASGRNTCARLTSGKVQCWGTNYYGQVANGKTWKDYTTSSSETKPTATLGIDDVTAMGGHFFHRCGVLAKGVLKCWGTTFHGALGDGSSGTDSAVVAPVTVALPAPAVDVAGGGFNDPEVGSSAHTCARLSTGAIHCWGYNDWGQLGDGGDTPSAKPVAVKVATCKDAKGCDDGNTCTTDTCAAGYCGHAAAGGSCDDGNACTLKDACDAGLCTAGANANCDDKDPCTVDSCDPKTAQCKHTPAADGATCGGGLVCSKAKCVSALGQGQCGADGTEPCKHLVAGGGHTCRVTSGGGVQCWGSGSFGQRGVNPPSTTNAPGGAAAGVVDAVHVVAGQGHTCALRKTGQVVCWGLNGQGQLGNGKLEKDYPKDQAFEVTAVPVSGLTDAVHLAASRFATCAVRAGGTVSCWGTDFLGQVGTASAPQSTPAAVKDVVDAVALAAGDDHFCVRTGKGAVQCWGWAGYGQLGNGKVQTDYAKATDAFSAAPVTVAGLGAVDRVWGGGSTVCARETDGKVQCWGRNDFGQVGNGKGLPDYPAGKVPGQPNPSVIPSLFGVVEMVGGTTHRCIRTSKDLVGCWGRTTYGALGLGSSGANTYVTVPALVNLVGSATELAAGGLVGSSATFAHSCAKLSNGQTWCWGTNGLGNLGDGTNTDANKPVQVKFAP